MFRGDRLKALLDEKGLSQSEFARRIGVSQAAIWKLINEPSQGSKHTHRMAAELDTTAEYLMDESDVRGGTGAADRRLPYKGPEPEPEPEHDPNDVAWIKEVDLVLGLGGAFLDGPVEERRVPFPRGWLRQYSKSPDEFLVFIRGKGTSMEPTIHDGDMCLLDLSRTRIDEQDELWACTYGGLGMIKRLKAMPDGTVKISSDNQAVRDELATDGDLFIMGRCCGVLRRT